MTFDWDLVVLHTRTSMLVNVRCMLAGRSVKVSTNNILYRSLRAKLILAPLSMHHDKWKNIIDFACKTTNEELISKGHNSTPDKRVLLS